MILRHTALVSRQKSLRLLYFWHLKEQDMSAEPVLKLQVANSVSRIQVKFMSKIGFTCKYSRNGINK